MNRRLVFWSAFAAVLMASVMVYGQQQGRGGRGQGRGPGMGGLGMMGRGMFGRADASMLLRFDAIKKEVKLTDEQASKLEELMEAGRPDLGNFREMSQDEREKAMAEFRKAAEERAAKLKELLTDEQSKRLEEIRIQMMGSAAIADEEIGKKLGITDAQQEKINAAREKLRDSMQPGSGFDREAFTKAREEYDAALMKVLTDEQTAKLKELKGTEFDLSQLRMGFGAGGGRGRAGGRGGRGN